VTTRRGCQGQRGAATAELALCLPLLVSLTVGLVWLLSVGETQVRLVDAAREAARAVARGDDAGQAVTRAREVAPGSTVTVTIGDGQVVATASDSVGVPGGLLSFLPSVQLRARAVSAAEQS
jgi:Flp pilus assembly protein TadG